MTMPVRAQSARAIGAVLLALATSATDAPAQDACAVVDISTGFDESLVLREDGTAWRLRDATRPLALPAPATAIGSADRHHVVLLDDGRVLAFGLGFFGELGPLSAGITHSVEPLEVTGLPPAVAIATGRDHVVALDADGAAWGWGSNDLAQLTGAEGGGRTPRPLAGLPALADVACGDAHCLGIDAVGDLWAWGDGTSGQVGHGAREIVPTPVRLGGPVGVTAIAAGEAHSLAVDADGVAWGWGRNADGAIADAALVDGITDEPVPLSAPVGAIALAAAGMTSFAVMPDGTVLGWGRNALGLVDRAMPLVLPTPTPVPALAGVAAIATSGDRALARRTDGTLATWGRGGALGVELVEQVAAPTPIPAPLDVVESSALLSHVVARDAAGAVFAWGDNSTGAVGDGSGVAWRRSPVAVPLPAPALDVSAGGWHSTARLDDGRVVSWGLGIDGQLGTGSQDSAPTWVETPAAAGAIAVAAGGMHSLALMGDGRVLGWGLDDVGQVAAPETASRDRVLDPVELPLPESMTAIACGFEHSLAIDDAGRAWGWGSDWSGQLGDTWGTDDVAPSLLPGLPPVQSIAAGHQVNAALALDGTAWVWGLSVVSRGRISTPVALDLGERVVSIAAGGDVVLVTESGRVAIVGGRLGESVDPSQPVPTRDDLTGAASASAALSTIHVVGADGTLTGWGSTARGEAGLGVGGFAEPALDPGFARAVPELEPQLRLARNASLGPAAVTLTWQSHHAADTYAVHRATLPDFADDALLLTVPAPQADDAALPGTPLVLYRVAGIDCAGVEGP